MIALSLLQFDVILELKTVNNAVLVTCLASFIACVSNLFVALMAFFVSLVKRLLMLMHVA